MERDIVKMKRHTNWKLFIVSHRCRAVTLDDQHAFKEYKSASASHMYTLHGNSTLARSRLQLHTNRHRHSPSQKHLTRTHTTFQCAVHASMIKCCLASLPPSNRLASCRHYLYLFRRRCDALANVLAIVSVSVVWHREITIARSQSNKLLLL